MSCNGSGWYNMYEHSPAVRLWFRWGSRALVSRSDGEGWWGALIGVVREVVIRMEWDGSGTFVSGMPRGTYEIFVYTVKRICFWNVCGML
jgi:hypothetical protein